MLKPILMSAVLLATYPLHANNVWDGTNSGLTIKQCSLMETGSPLDVAIQGQGYFILSSDKKDTPLLFARWGSFMTNNEGYVVASTGDYLMTMTKKSGSTKLKRIMIPVDLAPKATSKIELGLNLPAKDANEAVFTLNLPIYDGIANKYTAELKLTKTMDNNWDAEVFTNHNSIAKGTLVFSPEGALIQQKGLDNIPFPVQSGINPIHILFKDSTQYGEPFNVQAMNSDGYGVGALQTVTITSLGEFIFGFSNGQAQKINKRIALARFMNPKYLKRNDRLRIYTPTEKSGEPMIHWINNNDSQLLQGALEEDPC